MARTCKNRKAVWELNVKPQFYQNGWNSDQTRQVIIGPSTRWNEIACGHTERADDPGCEGCKWRNEGGE